MNLLGNVSDLVLKRVVNSDLGEVSLDSNMLNTLMQIDGVKTLEEIAKQLTVEMPALKEVVARLDDLHLVELDNATIPTLNENFFDQLTENLALAMGPMAEILIEDEILSLDVDRTEIPTHRGAELVEILAREIPRDEKKIKFQQTMLKLLKSM